MFFCTRNWCRWIVQWIFPSPLPTLGYISCYEVQTRRPHDPYNLKSCFSRQTTSPPAPSWTECGTDNSGVLVHRAQQGELYSANFAQVAGYCCKQSVSRASRCLSRRQQIKHVASENASGRSCSPCSKRGRARTSSGPCPRTLLQYLWSSIHNLLKIGNTSN